MAKGENLDGGWAQVSFMGNVLQNSGPRPLQAIDILSRLSIHLTRGLMTKSHALMETLRHVCETAPDLLEPNRLERYHPLAKALYEDAAKPRGV